MEQKVKKRESASKLSDKMLMIMECLADSWMPMRVLDIATKLNMNQPTVLRYLNSLVQSKYVFQEEDTLRYGLTMKICKLAQQVSTNLGIRTIAGPYLNKLSKILNVSSCLVIESNNKALYLDLAEKPGATLTAFMRIGKDAPLHAIASGKVLLSVMSEQQINDFVETQGLRQLTANTINTKEALIAELDAIRQFGYALDIEECQPGTRCVAVPIYNFTDKIVASLSIFDSTENIYPQRIAEEILPAMNRVQNEISMKMGSNIEPAYTLRPDHTF